MNVRFSILLIFIVGYTHHVQGMWGMGVGDRGGRESLHHSLIGYADVEGDSSSSDSSLNGLDSEDETDNDVIEMDAHKWVNNKLESMVQRARKERLSSEIERLRLSIKNYDIDDVIEEGRRRDSAAIATIKSILEGSPSDGEQAQYRADTKMVRPKHVLFETKQLRSSTNGLIAYFQQQKVTSYSVNDLQKKPEPIEKMSEQGQRAARMMLTLFSEHERYTHQRIRNNQSMQCLPHIIVPQHKVISSSKKSRIQQPMPRNNR